MPVVSSDKTINSRLFRRHLTRGRTLFKSWTLKIAIVHLDMTFNRDGGPGRSSATLGCGGGTSGQGPAMPESERGSVGGARGGVSCGGGGAEKDCRAAR